MPMTTARKRSIVHHAEDASSAGDVITRADNSEKVYVVTLYGFTSDTAGDLSFKVHQLMIVIISIIAFVGE